MGAGDKAGARSARILAFSGLVAAVATALSVTIVARAAVPRHAIPWWALALGFAVAESFTIHIEFRQNAHTFSLNELPLVIGLIFAAPSDVVIARVVGGLAAILIVRRQTGLKAAFNAALFAFEAACAAAIFSLLRGVAGSQRIELWAAAFGTILSVNALSTVAISNVIAIASGRRDIDGLKRTLAAGTVSALGSTALGLVSVELMRTQPAALGLVAIVATILFAGYRGYASLYQRYANLQRLYEFTGALARSSELEAAVRSALIRAGELMRASVAELYLFDAPGEGIRIVAAGEGLRTEPITLRGREDWVWTRVASEGRGVLLAQSSKDLDARAYLAEHGLKDLMIAPLVHGGRVIGALSVQDRLGEVSTFDEEDRKVFETLANHASISIQNSRLIDQLREEVASKQHQALHDMLTGLGNRRLFGARTEEALGRSAIDGSSVAVLLLDLNRFKDVNDSLGHHCGDVLLRDVGRRLAEAIPQRATVCRLGGDEFAVLLPHVESPADAVRVGVDIRAALEPTFEIQDLSLTIGAAIGVAVSPDHGTDAATLLRHADVAMYLAKESRDIEVYDPMRDQASARNLALAVELREAIEKEQLEVYFQPKANLATGETIGAEALCRWNRPGYGFISPDEFIPLAESVGLMRPLTVLVMRRAVEQAVKWQKGGRRLSVAVNLSARSIMDQGLPREVSALLSATGLAPDRLVLEITESQVVSDPPRTMRVLESLSSLGVELSIDDFGTGYSSLSYLQRLPVNEIKIDKSFVMKMSTDPSNASIVRTVAELGRTLGMRVVAEGVEDRTTWDALAAMGCDVAQGFFLSRPVAAPEFEAWLEARRAVPRLRSVVPPPDTSAAADL